MKKIFYIIMMLFLVKGYAQETYQKSFGEQGDEVVYSICESIDSGIAFMGVSSSFSNNKKIYLLRTDSIGQLLWSYVYGGKSVDLGRDIQSTKDGGFIMVGNTQSFGAGNKDVYVIKIDKKGEVEWSYAYGGEKFDYGFSVKETLDGGYILAGETSSFEARSSDVYVIKLDPLGNVQWSKLYGGPNNEFAYKIEEIEDGFIIANETNSFGAGGWDVSLIKINKQGDVVWYKTFGGLKDDFGYDFVKTRDGGYAMVGATFSYGFGDRDFYLIKIDKSGEIEWSKTYGGEFFDQCHGIEEISDGYILSGITNSFNGKIYGEDVFVMKVNSKGTLKWSKTYGGYFGDYGICLTKLFDGNLLIGGETKSFNGRDDSDMYVIKLTSNIKSISCEHSRVQAISIKQDFLSSRLDQHGTDVPTIKSEANTVRKEVLTAENIICLDDQQIIQSRRKGD